MKLGNESNQIDEAFDINEVYVVQKYSEELNTRLKRQNNESNNNGDARRK